MSTYCTACLQFCELCSQPNSEIYPGTTQTNNVSYWHHILKGLHVSDKYMRTQEKDHDQIERPHSTAGLPISYTVGRRHNFCCRGPILIPRPDSETSAQTTRVNGYFL